MNAKRDPKREAHRKTQSPASRIARRLLSGKARGVTLSVAVALLAGAGLFALWRTVGPEILADRQFQLTPEQIEITTPPAWIKGDVKHEVLRDASLDGPLSIFEPELTQRLARAFLLHPWVGKVTRVSKHHPARVVVVLEYRVPVCMVEVPGGLYPVDEHGILLPAGDFSTLDARRYPRLAGIRTVPMGPVGSEWGDGRVTGGAEIAAVIGELWDAAQLDHMTASEAAQGTEDAFAYEIIAKSGARIAWGLPPSVQVGNEAHTTDKLAMLRQLVSTKKLETQRSTPIRVDLRSAPPTTESPRTATSDASRQEPTKSSGTRR